MVVMVAVVVVVIVVVPAFAPVDVLALLMLVLMMRRLLVFARPGLHRVAVSARVIAVFLLMWRLVGIVLPMTMV